VKGDFDVTLPVDREFLPTPLVQRRGGRKRAAAQHQDIGLKDVENSGGRIFMRRIERQNFRARNFFG